MTSQIEHGVNSVTPHGPGVDPSDLFLSAADLWLCLPGRLVGKVVRHLPDRETGKQSGRVGFVDVVLSIQYPNRENMVSLHYENSHSVPIGAYVTFGIKQAPPKQRNDKKQPHLVNATNLEVVDEPTVKRIVTDWDALRRSKLAKTLEARLSELAKIQHGLESSQATLEIQRAALREQHAAEVAEAVASETAALQLATQALVSRQAELAQQQAEFTQKSELFRQEGGERFIRLLGAMRPEAPDSGPVEPASASGPPTEVVKQIRDSLESHGFSVANWTIAQMLLSAAAAAATGQFVVLSGPTGVGKTTLTGLIAGALGAGSGVVPVRPGWMDPSDLLGFFHPQLSHFQPMPFLDRVMEAKLYAEAGRLYFLTLDEMNLSRIENYAADLLSRLEKARAREADAGISLYSTDIEHRLRLELNALRLKQSLDDSDQRRLSELVRHLERYPAQMEIPSSLVLLGTVNLDETTHPLSPKMLDRSFVVKLPPPPLTTTLAPPRSLIGKPPSVWTLTPGWAQSVSSSTEPLPPKLNEFWAILTNWQQNYLSPLGIHLGFRFSGNFSLYMRLAQALAIPLDQAASLYLSAKLLPWVSFHRDDQAADHSGKFKREILADWAKDARLGEFPSQFGIRKDLEELEKQSRAALVTQYLE